MKKNLCFVACIVITLASCNFFTSSYGKKIKISDKVEVYIKGDSTTEEDGRKLGVFLDTTWKDLTNKRSIQLIKEHGVYNVGMVVDESKLKADSTLNGSFVMLRFLINISVYPESKVNLVLTDDEFKPYKTFKDEPIEGLTNPSESTTDSTSK
ncbi:MAG: hypothetical protein AMXMBFR79_16900 [Chitinophagaceae bacterium]|nr:hypothetical protein [Chitinophagaceae bacterium]MCZ2299718.1 hypothetical protein [Chitinophagales bacterium]